MLILAMRKPCLVESMGDTDLPLTVWTHPRDKTDKKRAINLVKTGKIPWERPGLVWLGTSSKNDINKVKNFAVGLK